MYVAPQTPDGRISSVLPRTNGDLEIEIAFPVPADLVAQIKGREAELVFAARSRLARLGINVAPTTPLIWGEGNTLHTHALVTANVKAYGVEPLLGKVLLPGVRVGRLVFCPAENRLSSEEVDRAVLENELQLPAAYSIDFEGRFRIRPEGWIYKLSEPLTLSSFTTIAARADGKDLLNRIQTRRAVDRIVLDPGDGVITSCSMFLHKHYVVLESEDGPLGQHLEAVVLDPVRTRGTNIFLEFANTSDRRIVNPTVAASMYRAVEVSEPPKRWFGSSTTAPATAKTEVDGVSQYERVAAAFDRFEHDQVGERYSHRLVAVVDDIDALMAGGEPEILWRRSDDPCMPAAGADVSAPEVYAAINGESRKSYGTCVLERVPDGARSTLLLGYFPNLIEHTQICDAALRGRVKRVIFRRASYEHGSFLSARDHGRLADFAALGVEVFWCNDERRHVATHIFRGLRGYFMEPSVVDRFHSALIFAGYGSAKLLAEGEREKLRALLSNLRSFFGEDIAVLTGGGPGAMQQATDLAQEMDMLVGASFIETVDQETNQTAAFYQTFQGRSRQARQRWFEVASFHLFFMGGVGTLEEVGLTLTDMKLGVIDLSPLVFFGRHNGEKYWRSLKQQFATMVEAGRAPDWLKEYAFVTDDPDAVPAFYKRVLELG